MGHFFAEYVLLCSSQLNENQSIGDKCVYEIDWDRKTKLIFDHLA